MTPSTNNPTIESYIAGYALSVLLTLVAFALAYLHISSDHKVISHETLYIVIPILALVQLFVQSVFFLHLSRKKEARATLNVYLMAGIFVVFIVLGSLWIMNNLMRNMSPAQEASYMHNEN